MPYPTSTIIISIVAVVIVSMFTASFLVRRDFPLPPVGRRIGCIDGLRGYLAISVLVHHFIIWTRVTRFDGVWDMPSVDLFAELGVGAVGLFFMITGLLFYSGVTRGSEDPSGR